VAVVGFLMENPLSKCPVAAQGSPLSLSNTISAIEIVFGVFVSTKIVIIAHAPLASALKDCALHVYKCDERGAGHILAVDVSPDADIVAVADSVSAQLLPLFSDYASTLILTDIVGASPANIAEQLLKHADTAVITGVNLPMVLAAVCHCDKPFSELCALVKESGSLSITASLSS